MVCAKPRQAEPLPRLLHLAAIPEHHPKRTACLPNNWISLFGGSAWTFDERSGEYYLHLFASKQPDLNYRNPQVLEEVKRIMRFWLNKGHLRLPLRRDQHHLEVVAEGQQKADRQGQRVLHLPAGAHTRCCAPCGARCSRSTTALPWARRCFVTPQMGKDLVRRGSAASWT